MHVRVFVWGNVLELCCVLVCAVVVVCGSGEVVVRVRVCVVRTYCLLLLLCVCVVCMWVVNMSHRVQCVKDERRWK